MRYLFQVLFHLLVTIGGALMIYFGIKNDNTALWVWGIVLVVAGNLLIYFLLFIIALCFIPAARKQDSMVGINASSISNRVKYCKKCGNQVDYNIMICPTCGNKTYSETKVEIVEEKEIQK